MAILGRLLMNRRAGETGLAWNEGTLAGPEILRVASPAFAEGGAIPREHAGRRVGGQDISPALNWTEQPADTAQLLLFVEDVDAPTAKPFVHCVALLAPDLVAGALPAGALDRDEPAAGVTLLRAQMGQFTPQQHLGFEFAAWYWHFVDVVWLFLFSCIYVWGSWGAAIEGAGGS